MARREELRALEERWKTLPSDFLGELRRYISDGVGRIESPFGDVDGRSDFRGLRLNPGDFRRRPQIGKDRRETMAPRSRAVWSRWNDMDFTGADLAEQSWMQHVVSNCVFDDADLSGLRCWGVTVEHSSFRRTYLHHCQLGPPLATWRHQSQWRHVDFRQADLRWLNTTSEFATADFRNAKFGRSSFNWSTMRDCQFRGVVKGVSFGSLTDPTPNGWALDSVDLLETQPRGLLLIQIDLGASHVDLQLPEDETHWHVPHWGCYLDRIEQKLTATPGGDFRRRAEIWLDYERKYRGRSQSAGFVALWDVHDFGGEPLVELLRSALPA